MSNKIIGGEFEIEDLPLCTNLLHLKKDEYAYSSGRAALYQILRSIDSDSDHRVKEIWLPDYLCDSMISAIKMIGFRYSFYSLCEDLCCRYDDIQSEHDSFAILLVNYFGLKSVEPDVREIRRRFPSAYIIEDDVQAFFVYAAGGHSGADYQFTSVRKSFPIFDGGLVRTRKEMPSVSGQPRFAGYKYAGAYLKARRGESFTDNIYLELLDKGEKLINLDFETEMSTTSQSLFSLLDIDYVSTKRRENASHLIEGIKNLGLASYLPMGEFDVPLFVPVIVPDREMIRRELRLKSIFCPVHWPKPEELGDRITDVAENLYQNELSLIVDQRYDTADMTRILEVIEYCLCR